MKPVRIVLSRRAGFDLQATSQAINGLPAQLVARPGKWGNPFTIADMAAELGVDKDKAQAEAIARYRLWIKGDLRIEHFPPSHESIRAELAGKNLACWCRQGSPCHADTLLELANE